jgi:hypothetical protein
MGLAQKLQQLQNRVARIISAGSDYNIRDHTKNCLISIGPNWKKEEINIS